MKHLFIKYKSVLKFIATFLLVYAILTFSYKFFLQFSSGEKYYPDYMTNLVAKQSKEILNALDYRVELLPHPNEASLKLIINEKYVARVIEGCNSVSIIILFISFIIAFASKFKITVLYIFAGSVLIYIANLVRIAILSIGLYHYPWRKDILHTVIFPAIIYGMVCLLWIVWVNRFSKIKRNA
ncbi:exosortase family protein XrtF [Oceanihabitans sp. 2_MG-2023]|uniref:exosortase family protein XrtF n=1 Tax=Oceanihabitans sp. 2_MG-2023 TaxID=3062661 RepID=UPI0026E15548|nr:exosortase family protein XrtF [Oceanihabitans sp. 2_MG-2023]MDO6596173.1 exosortase family protein XrtF [Oceanihabitans sp. 2_MG-2023]